MNITTIIETPDLYVIPCAKWMDKMMQFTVYSEDPTMYFVNSSQLVFQAH